MTESLENKFQLLSEGIQGDDSSQRSGDAKHGHLWASNGKILRSPNSAVGRWDLGIGVRVLAFGCFGQGEEKTA